MSTESLFGIDSRSNVPLPLLKRSFRAQAAWSILCAVAAAGFAWTVHESSPASALTAFVVAAGVSAAFAGTAAGLTCALLDFAAATAWIAFHSAIAIRPAQFDWFAVVFLLAYAMGYLSDRRFASEQREVALRRDLTGLRSDIAEERDDLIHFQDFSLRLLKNLELPALLDEVLQALIALQHAPFGLILLFATTDSAELELAAHAGLSSEQVAAIRPLLGKMEFSIRRRDVIEDLRTPGVTSSLAAMPGIRATYATPVSTSAGKPLGIALTLFADAHAPHEREIRLTELYARQAANAIENARLYRRSLDKVRREQHRTTLLRSLAEASLQIHSAVSLDSVLQIVTDKAREVVGSHQAFTSFAPHGNWTRSISCVSISPEFGSSDHEESAASSDALLLAYTTNGAVELIRPDSNGNTSPKVRDIKSRVLTAPLTTSDGHTMGAIRLANKKDGAFTEDDHSILVQLAHVASVAIENVHLLRKAQEQIGERERAQEALERSKQSLQLAQRAAGIGVWDWDLQLGMLAWSDEISNMHGMAPITFDGRYESWLRSIEPDDRAAVHRAVGRALTTGADFEVQYRMRHPEGSIHWIEVRGQVFSASGTPIRMSGVAMDITARKLSEEALRNSEKLAATGRLAATIAHEINNPLAAVTNILYLLRVQPELALPVKDLVATAETELSRVTHITRQTLGFYRDSALPLETDPAELIEEVLSVYARQIEQREVTVRKKFRFQGTVRAFPSELRQVIANLVCNAIEAVPQRGTIRIHLHEDRLHASDCGLRIVVSDNGVGIPEENRRHIFEPFFTTKGERGTGLGLWVTRGIIEKHGGAIRLRSSTGATTHGTCFSVFLPFGFFPRHVDDGGSSNAAAA